MNVAITGIGIASALGVGRDSLSSKQRPEPPAPIKSFDATKYPEDVRSRLVEVPDFDATKHLGDKGLRSLDRLTKLLIVTARHSLADAGLKRDGQWLGITPERVGVCCSNAYGSLEVITELDRVALLEDARYINPSKFPNTVSNTASGYVSIWEDLRALNISVSDGNCGGLDAISCADLCLANGRADAIVTGGGEAMSEALFLAFEKLGVLGSDSAGLGEGAAFLVLEPMEKATARGANVLGRVRGYGTAFAPPADDTTLLHAAGSALERAITSALADAGLESVDMVASGLAGIAPFDAAERDAITKVVPKARVESPKKLFGETLGAGGALGMAMGLSWLAQDPKLETVLVTSLGYYGNASAVVLSRS